MAGDGVVFARDYDKSGIGAVGLLVLLAAPQGYYIVVVAMQEEDGTLIG